MKKIVLTILMALTALPALAGEYYPELRQAMRDEIKRSMSELHMEDLENPYYIEYKITIMDMYGCRAISGELVEKNKTQRAKLDVLVRVGDYEFDNTNFFDVGVSFFGSGDDEESFTGRSISPIVNYPVLRRELWLATDAAYKRAAEAYSKKKAAIKNRMRKDTTHDFIYVEPEINFDIEEYPEFNFDEMSETVSAAAAKFRLVNDIHTSRVTFEYNPNTIIFVNSEGREYVKNRFYTGIEMIAGTQSDDGMPIYNYYSAYGKYTDDLPGRDSLLSEADNLIKKTVTLKHSEFLEDTYVGPVIFEDQAAAELLAQAFAPNLVAQRQPLTDGGFTQEQFTAFQRKIGGRVLPEFMSVYAKPQMNKYEGTPLVANYKIDDDGIEAENVILVKDGYLKNLLSDRVPTKRVRESNGHKRGGSPILSNIIFEGSDDEKVKSISEMRERMMELCKARELPYGLIIKRVMNINVFITGVYPAFYGDLDMQFGNSDITLLEVYKLYPDGREEPVRGARAAGFSEQSFKDIIAVNGKKYVHNYLAPAVVSSFISQGDPYVACSIVTPGLLFEDAEIRMIDEDFRKPPLISKPAVNN